MKKIILGKGLEERNANCNFCGEKDKDCIKGTIPFKSIVYKTSLQKVIEDYEYVVPFFGESYKKIDDYNFREVVIDKEYKIIEESDICKDCIKQLAKLV